MKIQVLNILCYVIGHKTENQEEKSKAIEKNLDNLSNLIVNCFQKNEQLKKHNGNENIIQKQ